MSILLPFLFACAEPFPGSTMALDANIPSATFIVDVPFNGRKISEEEESNLLIYAQWYDFSQYRISLSYDEELIESNNEATEPSHHNAVYSITALDESIASRCDGDDCILSYLVHIELIDGDGTEVLWEASV